MNTTPTQIQEAIQHATEELRQLNEQANSISLLHYRLQSTSAGIHLGTHTKEQLQTIQDAIVAAAAARDAIPTKQAAIKMLEGQLADVIAHARRDDCVELAARFDQLKKEYTRQSQDLLTMFRAMHGMHASYLGLTGRPLLHEVDYLLNLPATMAAYDSPAHSTGSIVRSAPVRMVA